MMLQTIISAIRNRECLSFTYGGLFRLVQPVAVGVSTAGHAVLRCYQVAGGHVRPGHDWNFCELAKMSNLKPTGEHFVGEPPGYRRGDSGMIRIYAEL